jgi:hypothetical protein
MMTRLLTLTLFAIAPSTFAAGAYSGPVIDGHNHWNGSRDAKAFVALQQKHNVVATIVMPRAYGSKTNEADLPTSDEQTATAISAYNTILFPTVGMQLPQLTEADWNSNSNFMQKLYSEVEAKLDTGLYFGIGEVILRHYPYFNHPTVASSGKHMQIEKSPDSKHFRKLASIANEKKVPINFHMEGEPSLVRDLRQVLHDFPRVTFIWAHMCGRISAKQIASLMESFPNLFCDLAAMTNVGPTGYGYARGKSFPERKGWPEAHEWTFIIEENGRFYPEVKDLLMRFPDRFIGVGMDNAHGSLPSKVYASRLSRFRELLGTLPPDVAKKLACQNAKDLWRLPVQCH